MRATPPCTPRHANSPPIRPPPNPPRQRSRSLYAEQTRSVTRKITQNLNAQGDARLVPWREIAMPHEDVRTGNFKEAEFAADLDLVHRGKAGPEYQDASEFFRRTYLTEGLTTLIATGLERLHGIGGDPVIELQTNFGGGKTHSMIALYHLGDGFDPAAIPGLDHVVQRLADRDPLFVQRAVLVGTKLSPNQARTKDDGTVIRTLWGELAWQLAGELGYSLIADSDTSGMARGAQILQELFELAGPSLILIDEWVAFVRQLYYAGDAPPVAGSFDANLSFAQALTEAVTNTPHVLLAASLPSSEIETGSEGGRAALERLKHTFSRVKASWRPASPTEGFEIVRRRLFQDVTDHRQRDATIQMFLGMYRTGGTQFPLDVQRPEYKRRMESAYPFHPETFDQLFETWGSLENFQRTRGVLRLMANVVHVLWERKDAGPLIMPANIPLDDVRVSTEIQSYLPDSWSAVIERDIDGDDALSLSLDRANPNYDKLSATRRVARTIFLGSSPTYKADNRGIGSQAIRLGVVQPGESAAIFGDALRTFGEQATYLYSDHGNYWFSTQPSIAQLAQQEIAQHTDDDADHWITTLLRKQHQSQRGEFERVVIAPAGSGDIADVPEVALVILGPAHGHGRNQESSRAIDAATSVLDTRGESRRVHRNALLFLAPEAGRLQALRDATRQSIVWSSIVERKDNLNLDPHQLRQAESRQEESARSVDALVRSTWTWLLVPHQEATPGTPVMWDTRSIRSMLDTDTLPMAASKRAVHEEDLILKMAASTLRRAIEEIPAFRDGWTHILARDLATWFSSYLYLPRLKNAKVLETAISNGANSTAWHLDGFTWADARDEETDRYVGLSTPIGFKPVVSLTGGGMLVHPRVARRHIDAELAGTSMAAPRSDDSIDGDEHYGAWAAPGESARPLPPAPRDPADSAGPDPHRYFGSVALNPHTLQSQIKEISTEVLSHLQAIRGADVEILLEINVRVATGIPEDRRRVVDENSKALKFTQSDFVD